MDFSEEIIQQVWEGARAMPDRDPTEWRKDECGAWMRNSHYGSPVSEFSWKIESVEPGSSAVSHLRAFHRDNFFDRSSGRAQCHVTADREDVPATTRISAPRNRAAR